MYKHEKRLIALYLVWVFLHVVFLLIGFTQDGGYSCEEEFWPFLSNSNCYTISETYGWGEFGVYIISPLIMGSIFIEYPKGSVLIYMIWVFINIIFLFIGFSNGSHESEFFPLQSSDGYSYGVSSTYDFSEFCVYVIGPVLIQFVYNSFSTKKNQ